MSRSNKDFGRDEFSSLLGATGEREALEAVRDAAKPKASAVQPRRHRDPTRQRAYHELLAEEQVVPETGNSEKHHAEDDADSPFAATVQRQRRTKTAPSLVSSKRAEKGDDDTSSSSSDEGTKRVDSSSSDDDSIDNRRQRLLSKRKRQAPQIIKAVTVMDVSQIAKEPPLVKPPLSSSSSPQGSSMKRARQASSSSESGSSEDESSSSSSDVEENTTTAIRPVFIPKHKRGVKEASVALLSATNAKPVDERRIAESRAMVQQAVTTVKKEVPQGVPTIDGVVGAMNDVPEDSDADLDHTDWVVRELGRLLVSRDLEEERLKEQAEIARRRNMTDEERMAEDAEKLQSQPKLERKNQRFFHKGAFYMDESEWDESDIRRKATEYAAAVTGDDKRDRSQLPKVMQVSKFGFANQSKWKGLAKEDTTDKRMEMLPLRNVPKKK